MLIDISKWNGNINFAKVKNSGVVDGVIIRCSVGTGTDKKFFTNIDGALANNLRVGVYVYSKATSESGAIAEAKHALDILSNYEGKLFYPVFIDSEEASTKNYAKKTCQAFVDYINKDGRFQTGVYCSSSWFKTYIKSISGEYTKWLAQWGSKQPSCDIWQFSSTGKIAGISGDVDLDKDISFKPRPTPEPPTPTGRSFMIELREIQYGDSGILVRTLQRLLRELYYNGADHKALVVDGDYGNNVVYAVRNFQKNAGLQVTGKCDEATWNYLLKGE